MSASNNSGNQSLSILKVNHVYSLRKPHNYLSCTWDLGASCFPNPLANTPLLNSITVHASAWKDTTSAA